jgi:hypothetical protein
LVVLTNHNTDPDFCLAANFLVQKNGEEWLPEESDGGNQSVEILVSSLQFRWLSRQCEFLRITKQQLVAEALEEWLCRNHPFAVIQNPSAAVRSAIDEFMRRHGAEFL